MAKQKYGPRLDHPQQHRAAIAYPSSSLLSILATIAASSHTVDGSPLPQPTPPPSFLCPFIEDHNLQVRDPTPTTSYSTITTPSSTTTTTHTKSTPQVADKYIQGSDGRWRKAQAWTLYGSTCCFTSPDLTIDDSQSTEVSVPTVSTQIDSAQIDSVLPAGWTTTSDSNRTDSIIILSLAIVLAVSICFFIIGCIVWRKRRKKRSNREKKKNDLELKARDKANLEDPSEDGERENEARGKNRLWARASARWKANIRHSARRRRHRRHGFSSGKLSRSQSPTLLDPREVSSSPVLSRRHSIPSVSEDNDFHVVAVENSPTPTRPPSTSPDPSCSHIVSSPPAYMFPARHMPPEIEEASHITSGDATPHRRSLLFPPAPEDDDISYHPSFAGHVAIDEKAHLARMAELASAPPVIQDNARGSVSPIHESAPEWYDDFEDPPLQPATVAPSEISPFDVGNSGFPIPPSKSMLSPGYFDGHSYLGDITTLDPISLPSMPPYEAGPNAIPFQETLRASAPPISEDDQAFDHWEGSAPEASDIYGDERDTYISPSPSLPSLSSAFSSQASAPPEQTVSMDGVLPIYQP